MNKYIILTACLTVLLLLSGCKEEKSVTSSEVVVLINSNTPQKLKGTKKLVPYLKHFGVNYKTIDLASEHIPPDPANYSLVVISHPEISFGNKDLNPGLENFLAKCQSKGIGILSFDPLMPNYLLTQTGNEFKKDKNVGELKFSYEEHYITENHQQGEKQELFGYMSIPQLERKKGKVLLTGNNHPLLIVSCQGSGKLVQWTSQDWMYSSILGPLGGLDDCLWKSIVWAARKPFVMQSLPPLVTMRVDDVVGCYRQQWDETPFNWIKIVNKYGFKPWLGLFIYNLTPEALEELKWLIDNGLATASPHALGRPPQTEQSKRFFPDYYYPDAIPYLSKPYFDEFIFFDHNSKKSWSDEIADKTLKAVDDWYKENGPLPMSNYLVAHWGEMGTNTVDHLYNKWNIEFILLGVPDKSYYDQSYLSPLIRRGPFYLNDEPVIGKPKENAITSRAYYSAEFIELAGKKFFFLLSEINDITGYEWRPSNDVEKTTAIGIETLSRGLEAKALAVLFTHETDHIFKIRPENWNQIFSNINDGISRYNPIYLTMDEALKIVRAFHTSEIHSCKYDADSNKLTIKITGKADVQTSIFVYTEDNEKIIEESIDLPIFEDEVIKTYIIPNKI